MLFKDLSRLILLNQNQQSANGRQIAVRKEKSSLLGSCDLVLQLILLVGNLFRYASYNKEKVCGGLSSTC